MEEDVNIIEAEDNTRHINPICNSDLLPSFDYDDVIDSSMLDFGF